MRFIVNENYNGNLLREYITNFCHVSQKTLTALKKKEKGILLNNQRVTVRAIINTGDILDLELEDSEDDVNPNVIPTNYIPNIIYEDESVLVVNKEAGMPTHTSFGHYEDSLSNGIIGYYLKQGKPFVFRAVNRLDSDTSGTVVIGKNKYYAHILSKLLEKGNYRKVYIAVLNGIINEKGYISGYIKREGESIIKRCLLEEKDKDADFSLTRYKRIYQNEKFSVVLCEPCTGRTHQLRVHFASLGNSIVGDTLYGEASEYINRQALHSLYISFDLPTSGKNKGHIAFIPSDMKFLMKKINFNIDNINEELETFLGEVDKID